MTLTKSVSRGTTLRKYDATNQILCLQWMDNKIVSLTSSLQISGKVTVTRRSGLNLLHLPAEKALKAYQDGMDGVDRSDQYRERGAGFASKSHYKKWYKKSYFAVLDFMLLNAFFAWNMSAEEVDGRFKLKRSEFYAAYSEELIAFIDHIGGEGGASVHIPKEILNGHKPIPTKNKERFRCAVCKLEEGWLSKKEMLHQYGHGSRQQRYMAVCNTCGISAHSLPVAWHRKIFGIEELKGLSCFEIAHHSNCAGLWNTNHNAGTEAVRKGKKIRRQCYYVSTAHPIYKYLRESYGFTRSYTYIQRKRKGLPKDHADSNEEDEFWDTQELEDSEKVYDDDSSNKEKELGA